MRVKRSNLSNREIAFLFSVVLCLFLGFFSTKHIMHKQTGGYIYILTNKNNTVLYTGVTNDLKRRLAEHQSKLNPKSFTSKYNTHKLVYFESFFLIGDAIAREKQIKAGSRKKKELLINTINPEWKDLSDEV